MGSWVALIVAVVVPVSGEIDRTDQRATASDGLLRRTASGAGQRIFILDCGVATTLDTSPRVSLWLCSALGGARNERSRNTDVEHCRRQRPGARTNSCHY